MRGRSGRSCCAQEPSLGTADRYLTGERRRVMVRRAILVVSAALFVAAVTISASGVGQAALAHRLCWGSAICASGLAATWIRQAMTTGRPGWRLLAAVAAVAAGIAWQPVIPAAAAVAALTEHTLRRGAVPVLTARAGSRQVARTNG
ncbi:MAG TPA: hypothetical protein VKS82_02710 [Streptosporangiaceae bacterium]|jgi:hypothetical protein|nr:hypothetical protein [Streptosporangiaceae bacterium]